MILEGIADRASDAAPPVAREMARVYSVHLSRVTLRRTFSAPGQFGTPAPVGGPPAWRTGHLAESVTSWPGAQSGMRATWHAGPHTVYAAVQQFGRHIYARRFKYMHWTNDGGEWWKKHVYVPARPYADVALDEVVADGSLLRSAALTFRAYVGFY